MRAALPVLTVVAVIVAFWYAMTVTMNAPWTRDQAARAGRSVTTAELVADTMNQRRPVLPAPHQVATELWRTTVQQRPTSPRSLLFHAWVTLSATLAGFGMGAALGVALAVAITHSRALELSLMPWIVASQTVPILAVAPMIIVVLNALGVQGLLPKALISTYLSFFPVVVGMVKGLRAPEALQLDQMRTWSATRRQTLWYLRLPAAMPYLFASLKVAIAASLVGAIVGELPTGAVAGLGARLLSGSYYGQTVQIWAALFAAAILAGLLVGLIGLMQRGVLRRMGMQP
jgi:NitT/TauT family transport system permease protein